MRKAYLKINANVKHVKIENGCTPTPTHTHTYPQQIQLSLLQIYEVSTLAL